MMTTTEHRPATAGRTAAVQSDPAAGFRRGAALLVGALALVLLVTPVGPLPIYYVPLVTGLAFFAAAAVSGRHSALWGAGVVVAAWGVGKVIQNTTSWEYAFAIPTVLLGVGVLVAAWMGEHDFAVSRYSLGFPIVFIGIGQGVHGAVDDQLTYVFCGLTAAWGLVELVQASRARTTA